MNRRSKILLYSLILLVAIYLKQCRDGGLFDSNDRAVADEFANEEQVDRKVDEIMNEELKQIVQRMIDAGESEENIALVIKQFDTASIKKTVTAEELLNRLEAYEKSKAENNEALALPCVEINTIDNGYSPYDSYFGLGVYHNWTQHSLTINTSEENAVCLVKDVYSGRVIRNEYVVKNSSFKMTGIPNGTYKLQYFSGYAWADNHIVPNTSIQGGFKCGASFSESSDSSDWLIFEKSDERSNHITVTLYNVANGNMETKEIDANSFF